MTSTKQDRDFAALFAPGDDALERAIDWISRNLSPDDVFSDSQLSDWAYSNDFTKEGV